MVLLSVVFTQCQQEPLETAPSDDVKVERLDIIKKSGQLGKGSVLTKIKLASKNGAESNLDSALGVLDLIELRDINGNTIQIWDSTEVFDFLDLEKGILNDIAIVPIPTGIYTHAICHIVSARVEYEGQDYTCKVPGDNMILEFKDPVVVGLQLSPELTLEIDMNESFFPYYSKSLYKNYIKYLFKLRRKRNWQKDFVTFHEFKKNKLPEGFIMNPLIEAINTTTKGSVAGAVIAPTDETFQDFIQIPEASLVLKDLSGNIVAETTSFAEPFYDEYNVLWNAGDFLFKEVPEGEYKLSVSYSDNYFGNYLMFDVLAQSPIVEYDISVLKGNFNIVNVHYLEVPGLEELAGAIVIVPAAILGQ